MKRMKRILLKRGSFNWASSDLTPRPPLHCGEGERSTLGLFYLYLTPYRDLTPNGVPLTSNIILNAQLCFFLL